MSGVLAAADEPQLIVDPAAYDAWYHSARGRWVGETEYRLLRRLLVPRAGESILDAGCGTGYFARRFRADGHPVVGADLDQGAAAFARRSAEPPIACVAADMKALPFAAGAFDCVVAVTSLCFADDERAAIAELLRVARRRIVIGLLNRRSLLWRRKGRSQGAYAGARWHLAVDARAIFAGLPVVDLHMTSAIILPDGGMLAQCVERVWPEKLPYGGLLAISASPSCAPEPHPQT